MVRCMSTKNKGSDEQCSANALLNLNFCGTHARSKHPKIWSGFQDHASKIVKVQALWRGYVLRNQLKLAGPGVLRRSLCHNDEELVTGDEKTKQDPLSYFSFEENGKIWWFDVRTMIQCFHKHIEPQNPYTRTPLTIETRKRLRNVYTFRQRNHLSCFFQAQEHTVQSRMNERWMRVSQMLEEHGFYQIDPLLFTTLNNSQLFVFLQILLRELKLWSFEHTKPGSRRNRYLRWTQNVLRRHFIATLNRDEYCSAIGGLCLAILQDCVDPYPVCFMIMSSLYIL
jgi:hypothetical protein